MRVVLARAPCLSSRRPAGRFARRCLIFLLSKHESACGRMRLRTIRAFCIRIKGDTRIAANTPVPSPRLLKRGRFSRTQDLFTVRPRWRKMLASTREDKSSLASFFPLGKGRDGGEEESEGHAEEGGRAGEKGAPPVTAATRSRNFCICGVSSVSCRAGVSPVLPSGFCGVSRHNSTVSDDISASSPSPAENAANQRWGELTPVRESCPDRKLTFC